MGLKFFSDYIAVEPIIEEVSTEGLVLPTSQVQAISKARVLKVSQDIKDESIQSLEGKTILYLTNTGTDLTYEDVKMKLIRRFDLIAVVE